MKKWVYVQAVVLTELLASQGPGAVSFHSDYLEAEDEDDAYTKGGRIREFRNSKEQVVNDFVVGIPEGEYWDRAVARSKRNETE